MMHTYNKDQSRKLLKVDAKTFDKWLAKAKIIPEPDAYDTRQKLLTYEQIVMLADLHKRPRPPLPEEDEPEPADVTLATLDERLNALEHLITQRFADLQHELTNLGQRITFTTQGSQTEVKSPAPRPLPAKKPITARKPAKRAAKTKQLPKTLVPLSVFKGKHKVSDKAVEYAIEREKLAVERGKWLYDGRTIMIALSQQGRHEFYEAFHEREGFQRCEKCPHAL